MERVIRPAGRSDASRLAEILIFTKRSAYRPIFQDDPVSFNEMQVLDLALAFRDQERKRENVYVYDDGIVRGMMRCSADTGESGGSCMQLEELYVDPFFQGMGIGNALLRECLKMAAHIGADKVCLWVLEKNERARHFYESHGFCADGVRRTEPGTPEILLRYVRGTEGK